MAERFDLVIVGAGPGGSSTAYHAAKAGLDTLLIDRQEFPRDKTCGDGLMPHAASEGTLMGLGDWLVEPHHGKFTGFSIYTERLPSQRSPHLPRSTATSPARRRRQLVSARSRRRRPRPGVRTQTCEIQLRPVTATRPPTRASRYARSPLVSSRWYGGFGYWMKATRTQSPRQYFRDVEGPHKQDLHVFITDDLTRTGRPGVFLLGTAGPTSGRRLTSRSAHTAEPQGFLRPLSEEPQMPAWLRNAPRGSPKRCSQIWYVGRGARQGQMAVRRVQYGHPISGEAWVTLESGRLSPRGP